ncbi:MAG: hypothetical protein RL591_716 [Planctomycetota bacterium]
MQQHALSSISLSSVILAIASIAPSAHANVRPVDAALNFIEDDTEKPVAMRADLKVSTVTLYRGRAAVTRAGKVGLRAGIYELRVGPLPETADLDSVQAKIGEGAKLIEVKTETVALPAPSSDNPRVKEALAKWEEAKALVQDLARQLANNGATLKTIDSIAAKVSSDASQTLGAALDPVKLEAQLTFIAKERDRLTARELELSKAKRDAEGLAAMRERELNAAGGAPPSERFALVTIVVPRDADVETNVTYLVANATWQPSYTIRGNPEAGALTLEFDANVRQATGEDWNDVALVLSTAQPTRAANPSAVSPSYIELYEPAPPETLGFKSKAMYDMPAVGSAAPTPMMDAAPGAPGGGGGEGGAADRAARRYRGLAADASVGGTGPAVEYRIPRTFTAASNADVERRTRVANLDAKPTFTLVAQPLVEQDVYLRARFRNESAYIFLPGEARMYLGADSIGRANLSEVPVGGEVELWFGKEPRVTARREMTTKKEGESGVFAKSKGIDRSYRIVLENTLTRPVDVEVWDRVPVSRNEAAKVELKDVTPALATDEKYTKDSKPQGLLKWTLALPARTSDADAKPVTISWKSRVSWPEGKLISGDVD